MELTLAFAATLLFAGMMSALAHRSVLSTAVLFLAVGMGLGMPLAGVLAIQAGDPFVNLLVEVVLFSVLFTDGMMIGLNDFIRAWRLPGRALLLGMPLVMFLTAALAHWTVGLGWLPAVLLGAILSPTDPVFASAIVGREEVPYRLRHLLNVESGFNDGLALPAVVALTRIMSSVPADYLELGGEILGGIALGVALPWLTIKLEGTRFFEASKDFRPLNAFAIGLLLFGLARTFHLNSFLAAFAGGMTIASTSPPVREAFDYFGQILTELLKLLTLLVFGAIMAAEYLGSTTGWDFLFVICALVLVRPIALSLALLGSHLEKHEWIAAAWFGPKGFASVIYGMFVLKQGFREGRQLFHLTGLVVAASIVAHSSTDVLLARWFHAEEEEEESQEEKQDKADGRQSRETSQPAARSESETPARPSGREAP